ncbi:hypothetical protein HZU40_31190 [Mycolicibacterium fluoranthenivorans]|uniref:DUF559 domain-containing protein n=1 Tax=Mycolicibacterium fluoranthenivorans TaxID=258505 RepID=A0A7G8PDX7_9MYCO|nr:hypothetical protein [Mycolicibacterium fluoranthenivorans]QNJ92543.1 hypothetical protein HZU40_31190 [Mycolicibacterium fluoranthenivorans]
MQAIDWPFRAGEMLDAGALTSWELRRFYQAVYPGVWIPRGAELTPQLRACAAWLWSGREGVVAGLSASAMLGAKWIEPGEPAQLLHGNRRPPALLTVHTERLHPDEVTGTPIPTTKPTRTAFDRAALLEEKGWTVIRVSAGLLRDRRFLGRVASALRARGCRDAFVPIPWAHPARCR